MAPQTAGLDSAYDGVVILSSSIAAMEPQSNSYRYATRFAGRLPTLFVQPVSTGVENLALEERGVPGLELLSLPAVVEKTHTDEVTRMIRERSLRRPLFWIYDTEYSIRILDAFPNAIRVYHLTEDPFSESSLLDSASLLEKRRVQSAVRRLLPKVDLVIATSRVMAESCRREANYAGRMLVAEDDCDLGYSSVLDSGSEISRGDDSTTPDANNSEEARFARVEKELLAVDGSARARVGSLNIAVLYDDRSGFTRTIIEHLDAFRIYSRHRIHFVPATGDLPEQVDLEIFDVIIHHYCVRLSLTWHLNESLACQVEQFAGLKILFIQDEYDSTETARRWIERLGFNIVYTVVPPESLDFVYPRERFPNTDFLPTLTGYVPELDELDAYSLPIEERSTLVAYRGRNLPFQYGELCQQKRRIGEQVKAYAQEHGYPVDIETDDAHRIYGADWYRFMGSARATLGTESGSNVFDFEGEITREVSEAIAKNPELSFEEVSRTILAPHEGLVRMNQVSPKVFEAIRLRTILVLYEGNYSGVVQPGVHYIPMKKDGSNLDEVFASLQNIEFLKNMAERAYEDVIASGRYSYKTFIEGVDRDIGSRVLRRARYRIYSSPVLIRDERRGFNDILREDRTGNMLVTTNPLFGDIQREQYLEMVQATPEQAADCLEMVQATPEQAADSTSSSPIEPLSAALESELVLPEQRSLAVRSARRLWRLIPQGIRFRIWSRVEREMRRE